MAKKPVVHMICNAHIDPIWNWHWEEGALEAISTFRTAADFMDEFPEFIFNHNESLLYEWIEMYDPVLFARIQELVKAGRWNIAGGWYLQPDCNLPAGETFTHLASIGLRYFQSKFGVRPKVAYNFDPFGHNGSLPQILSQCGYGLYIFCRPGSNLKLPYHQFRWRGLDGSEILALRPPTAWYGCPEGEAVRVAQNGIELSRKTGEDSLVLWGMGDHGGGASRTDLQMLRELMAETTDVEVRHSTPEAYLAAQRPAKEFPVLQGDMQRVFAGCYISIVPIKRSMRYSESLLRSAEAWSALAWWTRGKTYPTAEYETAWKGVCFNAFHDIITGSTRQAPAAQDVQELFGRTAEIARRHRFNAQLALMPNVKPKLGTVPLYVYNPHTTEMSAPVSSNFLPSPMPTRPILYAIYDDRGRKIASQNKGGAPEDFGHVSFIATIPALSVRRYEARLDEEPGTSRSPLSVKETKTQIIIENRWLTAKFSRTTGGLSSLVDKVTGRDLLKGSVRVTSNKDNLDAWGWEENADFSTVLGDFTPLSPEDVGQWMGVEGASGPAISVLFEGPVKVVVQSLTGWRRSRVCQQFSFFAELPFVDVDVRIHWQERGQCAKWVLPLRLQQPRAICEVPYAAIERATDGSEHVGGRWVRMEETGKDGLAVGVASNRQYSFHARVNGELGMSLVRGAVHTRYTPNPVGPNENHQYMDQGQHDFRFRLLWGKAATLAKVLVPAAMELNIPLEAFFLFNHPMLPADAPEKIESLLDVAPATVVATSIKKAEDSDDLIIRLNETIGKKTKATVKLVGMKEPTIVEIRPFEIKTLRASRTARGVTLKPCNLLEE